MLSTHRQPFCCQHGSPFSTVVRGVGPRGRILHPLCDGASSWLGNQAMDHHVKYVQGPGGPEETNLPRFV